MAGSTKFYGMAFFDFGDQLDVALNVQREIDRFVLIDKQIYGMYNVFGNGVISGWEVTDGGFTQENGISVVISPGVGIIRFIASETAFPDEVVFLPPNTETGIYAILRGSTTVDREIEFVYSQDDIGDSAIKLASIITGSQSVESIDNTDRDLIGFREIIREEINKHKHRGIPSKIDLAEETRNQLPGARIGDLDASKITTGILDKGRIPQLDHDDLDYTGLLSHAQLDSFVQTLLENNRELLGEITTVNLLKHIIFMKYRLSDIDEHFINELAIIPGISPNTFIDFDSSTAYIDLVNKCISGIPPKTGEFVSVDYNTTTALNNAFELDDVDVTSAARVRLSPDDSSFEVVEDFEGVPEGEADIPTFTNKVTILESNVGVVAEATDTLRTEGFYSGRFTSDASFRSLYTKEFSTTSDWTSFEQLSIDVKTLSASHGSVWAYFESFDQSSNSDVRSDLFLLLSEDEITNSADDTLNDFERKVFDISEQTRRCVKRFVIFTDDINSDFKFYIDNIIVSNTSLFKTSGKIRLRYSGSAQVTFHSIFYDSSVPDNTSVLVRVKTANSASLLSRAQFTPGLASGTVFALPGTDAEIEIQLATDDQSISPTVSNISLRLLVDSENHGFDVISSDDFSRGTSGNITITKAGAGLSNVSLTSPINVGGYYFSFLDAIRENSSTNKTVFGFSGPKMPISPRQAGNWNNSPLKKFEKPVSVYRTYRKTYIIADRDNDRVLEVNSSGTLIKGFGSSRYIDNDNFFPLSAVYNENTGVLSVAFSKTVDKASVSLDKISLFLQNTELPLTNLDQIVAGSQSERVIDIKLTADKQDQLAGFLGDLYVNFLFGAFAQEINIPDTSQDLFGIRGLPCFMGDFTFVNNIAYPVSARILESGNWIVCNSLLSADDVESDETGSTTGATDNTAETVASLVEFNPDSPNDIVFSFDEVKFSTFSLGGVTEYGDDKLAVAGIFESSESINGSDAAQDNTVVSTTASITTLIGGIPASVNNVRLKSIVLAEDDSEIAGENGIPVSQTQTGVYSVTFNGTSGKEYEATFYVQETFDGSEQERSTTVTAGSSVSEQEKKDAISVLADYRGTVVVVDRNGGTVLFTYVSPDGLYPSDVDVDTNNNNDLIISESDFVGKGGRVIRLDRFNNITFQLSNNGFGRVRDVRIRNNGNMVISL